MSNSVLRTLAPWLQSNFIKRVLFGSLLVTGFFLMVVSGPVVVMLTALTVQVVCFAEVLSIAYNYHKIRPTTLPYFRSLAWYFLIAANYFFFGETVATHFKDFYAQYKCLQLLVSYHRFISFVVYFAGIILFVFSQLRRYDWKMFRILAWTHTLLILIVLQSYMVIENIFQGLIWLILPVSLVTINDIFAYIFGRLLGKTPLIELSPTKTWEGFIGGGVGTLVSGHFLSNFLCRFQYLVCPIEYKMTQSHGLELDTNCPPSELFTPSSYSLFNLFTFDYYPFSIHFLSLTLFASIIAPFGGFCASGFKRAFKVKDFSDIIPGHGGIMDRFDCQYLMITFVNVYIFTFVKTHSIVDLAMEKTLALSDDNQREFLRLFQKSLEISGLLHSK